MNQFIPVSEDSPAVRTMKMSPMRTGFPASGLHFLSDILFTGRNVCPSCEGTLIPGGSFHDSQRFGTFLL
ncbi:hypothetical protein FQA47_025695 [Oryzias melastigma]|uniref:Uncharacterized protein n=1 Tax=Oryzias melastigma TaxID=30732 RepID=A0A834CJ16_ORYME|nr:hypothetical protein FQA47_025695 [Oryzias melastigma]